MNAILGGVKARVWNLRTFVLLCLLLFLAVSYQNTLLLVREFHVGHWRWVAWAFAGAIEVGILGLAIIIANRKRGGLDARPFERTLVALLALSVAANFMSGVNSYYPDLHILTAIRDARVLLPGGWYVPLWALPAGAFAGAVPLLLWAFAGQLATLEAERQEATETAANPELMMVALYALNPGATLAAIARQIGTSESTAARMRGRLMERGLLTMVDRGRYLPSGRDNDAD